MIVQLPLPSHVNERAVIDTIDPQKDIDGLHPWNMGSLAMKHREPLFVPCTPRGCVELLEQMDVNLEGKHVVVIGRSNIVGTITFTHTFSAYTQKVCLLLCFACGRMQQLPFVTQEQRTCQQ